MSSFRIRNIPPRHTSTILHSAIVKQGPSPDRRKTAKHAQDNSITSEISQPSPAPESSARDSGRARRRATSAPPSQRVMQISICPAIVGLFAISPYELFVADQTNSHYGLIVHCASFVWTITVSLPQTFELCNIFFPPSSYRWRTFALTWNRNFGIATLCQLFEEGSLLRDPTSPGIKILQLLGVKSRRCMKTFALWVRSILEKTAP